MKKCIICGKEIINGVNGCMLLDDCFDCHGGYPKYAPATARETVDYDDDRLNYLEAMCVRDWED